MAIAALPGELGDLVKRFKRGYTVERTRGGHYRVLNPKGERVQYQGKNLTLTVNPGPRSLTAMQVALSSAGVLRDAERRRPRRSSNGSGGHDAAVRAMSEANRARFQNRQRVARELHDRLGHLLRNVGALDLPGMAQDLGAVGAHLARQSPEGFDTTNLTPDLFGSSARRVAQAGWVEPRYQRIWNLLADRLEAADDVIDEWFALVREAKGLHRDETHVVTPSDSDWPFTVELLPHEALLVDHDYQRPVPWEFVRKTAALYDETLVGTIDVAERRSGATYAVLDGQLRLETSKLVGKTTMWCSVYRGMDKATEARHFLKKNRDKKVVHPYYTFRARLVGEDADAVEIARIVEAAGYKLSSSAASEARPDNIAAIAAVERVGKRRRPDGTNPLAPTLRVLRAATYGRVNAQNSSLIQGIGYLFATHDDERLDEERLTGVVARLGPDLILGRARDLHRSTGSSAGLGVARILVSEYNSGLGRGNGLPMPTHTSRG
jgi:uncharacterized protein DUF6551